jgi:hypothetical protein
MFRNQVDLTKVLIVVGKNMVFGVFLKGRIRVLIRPSFVEQMES